MSTAPNSKRLSFRLIVAAVGAASALLICALLWRHGTQSPETRTPEPEPSLNAEAIGGDPATRTPRAAGGRGIGSDGSGRDLSAVGPSIKPLESPAELISGLFKMEFKDGRLSTAQAAQINQAFKDLVFQGTPSIAAIRDFLARDEDVRFGDLPGGKAAEYGSLRAGLLDVLDQIGGEEALKVALQVLQTTKDPWELAIVARNLGHQAPGQFTDQIVEAAIDTLNHRAADPMPGRDVAPLFQILQGHTTPEVISALEANLSRWEYYAMRTLAGLPDGQGVPVLLREAANPERATAALQMLAQISGEHPEASAALIEKTRANQIPDTEWPTLALILGGAQLEVGTPLWKNPAAAKVPGIREIPLPGGDQTLYTLPFTESLFGEQLDQRIGFIDQLLAVNPSPSATEALQSARSQLVGMRVDYVNMK